VFLSPNYAVFYIIGKINLSKNLLLKDKVQSRGQKQSPVQLKMHFFPEEDIKNCGHSKSNLQQGAPILVAF
jgi:hypothetical protein